MNRQEVILRYFTGVHEEKFAGWTQFKVFGRDPRFVKEVPAPKNMFVGKIFSDGRVEILKYVGRADERSGEWVMMPKEMGKLIELAIFPHEI